MLSMLLAYDASDEVVATLDYCVARDPDTGRPVGLVDFAAHEEAGGEMTEVWTVDNAVGSKVWPEWIGARAHDFRVERTGPPGRKKITALVHKTSGHRRERAEIESRITRRINGAKGKPADIRDIVGGPERPLVLDDDGRDMAPPPRRVLNLPVKKIEGR